MGRGLPVTPTALEPGSRPRKVRRALLVLIGTGAGLVVAFVVSMSLARPAGAATLPAGTGAKVPPSPLAGTPSPEPQVGTPGKAAAVPVPAPALPVPGGSTPGGGAAPVLRPAPTISPGVDLGAVTSPLLHLAGPSGPLGSTPTTLTTVLDGPPLGLAPPRSTPPTSGAPGARPIPTTTGPAPSGPASRPLASGLSGRGTPRIGHRSTGASGAGSGRSAGHQAPFEPRPAPFTPSRQIPLVANDAGGSPSGGSGGSPFGSLPPPSLLLPALAVGGAVLAARRARRLLLDLRYSPPG